MKNQVLSVIISIFTPVILIGVLLYFFGDKIKSLFNRDSNFSNSNNIDIDSSIQKINASFDRFGTDFKLFMSAFSDLSKSQIERLFVDFGTRYYNKLTGMYSKIQVLEGFFISKRMKLKEIIIEELTDIQLNEFKTFLKSKNVIF